MRQRRVDAGGGVHPFQQRLGAPAYLQSARQFALAGYAAVDAVHHHGDDLIKPALDLGLGQAGAFIRPHHRGYGQAGGMTHAQQLGAGREGIGQSGVSPSSSGAPTSSSRGDEAAADRAPSLGEKRAALTIEGRQHHRIGMDGRRRIGIEHDVAAPGRRR